VKNFVIVIATIFVVVVITSLFLQFKPAGVWINCGLSEISPDFTNEMREACRQARSQYDSRIKQ
jgi:hypothetical protein